MRLSLIFSAYVTRSFLLAFGAVLLLVVGLIVLFDTIELMRRLASRPEATFSAIVGMALLKLPQMLHVVLPFAVMLGGMISFWRLTRSHEMVVARSVGISVWQILTPIVAVAMLIGVIEVTVFNPVAAALHSRFERMEERFSIRDAGPLTVSENGLWLREVDERREIVVHVRHVRQKGVALDLQGVSIYVLDGEGRFDHRIEADHGTLDEGHFNLAQAYVLRPGRAAEPHGEFRLQTTLTLNKIQDNFASPESISFWELPEYIAFFESSGFSAHKQRLYWHSLLSSPLLLCAMVLVAAVFSLRPNQRSGGILARLVGGVAVGLLFYFFSKVAYALGASTTLPLALAAWSPPAVTGLAGLALLFHLEDG